MSYIIVSDINNPHTDNVKKHLLALNKDIVVPERFKNNLSVSSKLRFRVTQPLERNTTVPRTWRLIRYAYTEFSNTEYFVEVPSFDLGVYKDKGFYVGIHLGKHTKYIKAILSFAAEHIDEYMELLKAGYEFTIGDSIFNKESTKAELLKSLTDKSSYSTECYCRLKIDFNCSDKDFVHSIEEVLGNELLFNSLSYGRRSA